MLMRTMETGSLNTPLSGGGRNCAVYVASDERSVLSTELLDRRKTFRTRGSLGPTVSSAPSVELQDYRTPRLPQTKTGKSFDLSVRDLSHSGPNGLIKVSADFLRLNGSRQQFRNLLATRRRCGQLPPTIDSVESIRVPYGPVITIEDTASDNNTKCEQTENPEIGTLLPTVSSQTVSKSVHIPLERANSRHTVPIDGAAVKATYKFRAERLNDRVRICDSSVLLALFGMIITVIDSEITSNAETIGITKDHLFSRGCRTLILLSTSALLYQIIRFHLNEIRLEMVDCGADDWRIVCGWRRLSLFLSEFIICGICPLPWTGTMNWSFIEPRSGPNMKTVVREVPVDVVLSLLMISRFYHLCRFFVLHSKQFQDASTRTLAALNRIQVDFKFVLKTSLEQRPMSFLTIFLLAFWFITAWSFAQCERIGREEDLKALYSNSLWFIAATFNGNGYGDIVPKTIAGRIIGILVGVIGGLISSVIIAIFSRKLILSTGQKNVNRFMNETRICREYKNTAARVLQKTWSIYKCFRGANNSSKLRRNQRKFLSAIHDFRRAKKKFTKSQENNDGVLLQIMRSVSDIQNSVHKLNETNSEMRGQIEVLQRSMRNHFKQRTVDDD